jgi:hypothetical protein
MSWGTSKKCFTAKGYFKLFLSAISLGAYHDGSGSATACPESSNNIMTPFLGLYSNANGLFHFSNCSINSFKQTLLSYDMKLIRFIFYPKFSYFLVVFNLRNVSARCLLNVPALNVSLNDIYSSTKTQIYSLNDQCKLILGPDALYAPCYVNFYIKFFKN